MFNMSRKDDGLGGSKQKLKRKGRKSSSKTFSNPPVSSSDDKSGFYAGDFSKYSIDPNVVSGLPSESLQPLKGDIHALKWFDVPITVNNMTSGVQVTLLNYCTAGSDVYHRIGKKLLMKRIRMRIFLYVTTNPTSALRVQDFLKFSLIYDADPSSALPSSTTIYADMDYLGSTSGSNVLSFPNRDDTERFKILREKIVVTSPNHASQECCDGRTFFEWDVDCDLETIFNSNSFSDVRDISKGALYFYAESLNGNGLGSYLWSCSFIARIFHT